MTLPCTFRRAMPGNILKTPSRLQQSFVMPTTKRGARRASALKVAALSQDELKQQAAFKAVEYVKSGQAVGLGTGSTAAFAVARIGQLLNEGKLKDIVAVPTSIKTFEQAKSKALQRMRRSCMCSVFRTS